MPKPTRSGEETRRAAPSGGTQPSETTDYRPSSSDSSAAKAAGPGFPEGSTLEQTGPETWQLTMPGPTEEELRYAHEFPPQTLTYEPRGTT